MAVMRDKLIHDYFGIDVEVVWNTATENILKLEKEINQLVSESSQK